LSTPVRAFLDTASGSAGILTAAIVLAVVWANLGGSYESVWTTPFVLVVGLEARREIDLGDLRDRGRVVLPVAAGLVAMVVSATTSAVRIHHSP
jgi:Na+/H+ antiporter NhaA